MLAFFNDYYGFILRATQSVELFCAYDVETYEKYEEYAKTISKETMEKLEKVNVPLLEELKEKLLETGKGIEQESFLIEE